jgi:predicted RNA-binding protein YlqC (UPF0109 family)
LNPAAVQQPANPNYAGLVRFLVEPFLEAPESLRIDCEIQPRQLRAWIRLAFDDPDKGRVYGRGGRNIHAIRAVLEAVAKTAGQSIYLDIYDGQASETPRYTPRTDSRYGPPRTEHTTLRPSLRDRPLGSPRSREPLGRPPRESPRSPTSPRFRTTRSPRDFR